MQSSRFSTNVLFLFQDPIQDITLHLGLHLKKILLITSVIFPWDREWVGELLSSLLSWGN